MNLASTASILLSSENIRYGGGQIEGNGERGSNPK